MEVCPFWKNNTKQGNTKQMETNLLSWTWSERGQAHVQAPATDLWATSSKLLLPPILVPFLVRWEHGHLIHRAVIRANGMSKDIVTFVYTGQR